MKIHDFEYTKPNGEKSLRRALILHSDKEGVDTIDLRYLSAEEQRKLFILQRVYEDHLRDYVKKGYRRFLKGGIHLIKEDAH